VEKGGNKLKIQKEILKLPYLVLCVSLLFTIGATYIFYNNARAKDLARFQSETQSVTNRIDILIRSYIAMMKAGRGFIEANDNVNREKFSGFVKNLELGKTYNGIQGLGFSKRIASGEKQQFLTRVRAEGMPEFQIFPESESSEFQTILFLEPPDEQNEQAIGFDMSSESIRREALEKARDSGEPAATGKVVLVQESKNDRQPGFLIFLPVYKSKMIPETVEDRRRFLDGYIYTPLRAGNFLREVQKNSLIDDVAVTIYEGEKKPENILAQTEQGATANDGFQTTNELNVASRTWLIEFQTLPLFSLQSSTGWTPLIFIVGLIFSLLLFGMTYLESFARIKAENFAEELQESEREKAKLLEREQVERKRAEEANKTKDEFISIVSHELRTPLNSIAGWSKILQAENLTPIIKKQALQKIDKSLRVQTKIVEELLDFSQLISNKEDLSRKQLDVSKIFEESCAKFLPEAEKKEVVFEQNNLLNGQRITGNVERIKRVFDNLLSNAVKFTPASGKIIAEIKETNDQIEFSVTDNGEGINSKFLPHIFERFMQADSSTTRQHGGLGLGLAISHHIVKIHGGSITAESEGENKGANFTVYLPCERKG
jgi:signal transduction histidine kinase